MGFRARQALDFVSPDYQRDESRKAAIGVNYGPEETAERS